MKNIVLILISLTIQITTLCSQELDLLQGYISEENIFSIKPTTLNGAKINYAPIKLQFNSSKISIHPTHSRDKYLLKGTLLSDNTFNVISVDQLNSKIKPVHFSNGLTDVRLLLRNDMLTTEEAKRKNVSQNFIRKVRLFEGDNVVFNATLTPYVSNGPSFRFKYYGGDASVLKLETIDNNNHTVEQYAFIAKTSAVRDFTNLKKMKENNQLIKLSSPDIQKEYGNKSFIKSKNIKIIAPVISQMTGAIPVRIQSNIKAKSVALFATESKHEASYWDIKNGTIDFTNKDLALVCKYHLDKKSIIDFLTRIKLSYGENSKVLVVVEAEDGKLYIAEKPIAISMCIDSGG